MTLKDYAQKLNGFERPVATFKINGAVLSGKSLLYHHIKVSLSSSFEASDCVMEVGGQYTRFEKGKLSMDEAMGNFVLGAKLEVFLGYGEADSAKQVFTGYLSSIEFELQGDTAVYHVTAMDTKQFMMLNFRSERKKDLKKYSEAAADVLSQYSAVCEQTVVEESGEITSPIEQHNQSDYHFVVSLAQKLNYLFYVINGSVHFVSYQKYSDSLVTVEPGSWLHTFRREISLSSQVQSVKVRGYNPKDPDDPFEGTAAAVTTVGGGSQSGSQVSKLINSNMQKIVVDHSVKSAAEAAERAGAILNKLAMEFVKGEMELVGMPDLFPGHLFTVSGLGGDLDRTYFITDVVHEVSKDGYTTTVKFGGSMV